MNFWKLIGVFECVLLLMIFIIGIGNCLVLNLFKYWYNLRFNKLVVVLVVVIEIFKIVFVFNLFLFFVLFKVINFLLRVI